MNYQLYKQARDAAWLFLLENNVCSLPVTFSDICRINDIRLMRYLGGDYFENDERGVTYIRDGRFNILVNGADELPVQRFTIGHELGHIFMGHLSDGSLHTRISNKDISQKEPFEYQAERFAMGILAPACVLWGLNLHGAEEIARICNISHAEAESRAARMNSLYKRGKFFRFAA